MRKVPTCEYILKWYGGKDDGPIFCGLHATARYPAHGGGYMHLCPEHTKPHLQYAESIPPMSANAAPPSPTGADNSE